MRRADTASAEAPIPRRYIEQAAQPGGEVAVRERLPAKLRRVAADNRLVALVQEAYGYVTDPRVPHRYKLLALATLLYFISPFDAIPDWIPGAGYIDDIGALTAFVVSVRKIIDAAQDATKEVVSHAISEAQEAWARRGISQVFLALWASTIAACVGLIYHGTRAAVFTAAAPVARSDPFVWACLATGVFGFYCNLLLARRVWTRYSRAPSAIREPLAYAIIAVADSRRIVVLALPVIVLTVILVLRIALRG